MSKSNAHLNASRTVLFDRGSAAGLGQEYPERYAQILKIEQLFIFRSGREFAAPSFLWTEGRA